jgi:predicted dehydrogenase
MRGCAAGLTSAGAALTFVQGGDTMAARASRKKVSRDTRVRDKSPKRVVRYAVVGLGHIAQVAVLPAFAHAKRNSRLVALVSGDADKRRQLERRHKGVRALDYDGYDALLRSGEIDAVYIALPNNLHRQFSVAAAQAGVHVLCEKPMAVTEDECVEMIAAAEQSRVKLMIAYRLHFDSATLRTLETVRSGRIGEPRAFGSLFTMQVRDENIRLERELGGGPLYDIGIYCINAARHALGAEPLEVVGASFTGADPRFAEVEESFSAILRFPGDRVATFTCSFGASDISSYRIVGTKGDVHVEPAYEYQEGLTLRTRTNGRTRTQRFEKRDQFAPELLYFSDCILEDREPEPSGLEGLIDVHIIRALYESARTGQPVAIAPVTKQRRPGSELEMRKPPVRKPDVVHAESASR